MKYNFKVLKGKLTILLFVMLISLLVACGNKTDSSINEAKNDEKNNNDYPESSIEVIVPFGAGGGTDSNARAITPHLEDELGVNVTVINKPGAAAEIGTTEIANSKSDGYTLGVLSYPDNVITENYKETDYNDDDFIYLAQFTQTPNALLVNPNSEFETLAEFIDYAKENPGKLTVSYAGEAHLVTISLIEEIAGIELTPIVYESGAESVNAVLGNHVDANIATFQFVESAVKQGANALAVANEEKITGFEDIPTFIEEGFDISMGSSRMIVVQSGAPEEVVEKLREALDNIGNKEELEQAILDQGEVYQYRSGEELLEYTQSTKEVVEMIVSKYKDNFVRD